MKDKSVIRLYAWCFNELSSHQLESVEAEVVFMIRSKTGIWPIYQNEIHFNNDYEGAREIAEKIFNWILTNS